MAQTACSLELMAEPDAPPNGYPSTFRQALDGATDFGDFLDRLLELGYEGPDLLEVLDAERHGGGWVPKHTHPE
ncbi:MAG: hypothetical protein F4X48_02230 [Acidimicrobiia bacterium]|nr:hypothetical protein [Acidimicrobiia bacterium]MYC57398.1 hypothetical protein [Acidimicrobiia bacterium]MYI30236.1 hypothetical protein [Acidimicrobiia bacterium]